MNRPTQWWQDMPERYEPNVPPVVTVFPIEPVNTGLLDFDGRPIMRSPEKLGFLKEVP
jgi:hypothetical protein